ncbi:zf-HC2 domain-containing protein [Kitasatospora sp. NPDC002040]|uniref:zf-HC2 domain-containing protein n=1 Tax=Kitasatospora sp. NPDC002040 TaxID=3154661 RepID=UPI0033347099
MTSAEPTGRARRGSGWAQLGRRAEPVTELRPVPLRAAEPVAEQHHLGDRLSAFVDGELDHDARERVQAHLATCADCLAEADESRAAKQLLTTSAAPGPSALLMSRLLAVASLPEDEDEDDDRGGPVLPPAGVFGGSRLTGGSFGRGAGATFGAGALGAGSPLPGVDPRARRSVRPLAALAETQAVVRPAPRGRRFVFAAAGAFSVAAVTLGGVSAVSGEELHGTVSPVSGPGAGSVVVPADYPAAYPVRGPGGALAALPSWTPTADPALSPVRLQQYLR